MTIFLGCCPFVVHDEDTAAAAGEWAQQRAESLIAQLTEDADAQ